MNTKTDNPMTHVIALGASAGGIEALETFFQHMPSTSGAAFVVIQHLDPARKSLLVEILQRQTPMPVHQAENDLALEANTVYVIPPNARMGIFNHKLQLLEWDENLKIRLSIDFFLRALAEDQQELAIGIVLSGTGSDGTLGLKDIKGAGGLTLVQEPLSAGYDGMPRSAIATGLVDFILPPEKMPAQIMNYLKRSPLTKHQVAMPVEAEMTEAVSQILYLIRSQTGHDFTHYKPSTVLRRIARLMAINQIEDIAEYVHFLQNNQIGIEALFRDMLIGVTSFFRDKAVFERIQQIIPSLFQNRQPGDSIRLWVPGCSTGEEAYSLAMLVHEHMEALKLAFRVQIFATDIDTHAINAARLGRYPLTILADVPEAYLHRYFLQTDHHYQIIKPLRDMLVFAQHNVIKDPPFSRLDLISCRNLLIYFDTYLQEKILDYFHFALLPAGFLVLGSSESLGKNAQGFKTIDLPHKIFQTTAEQSGRPYKGSLLLNRETEEPERFSLMREAKLPPGIRELTEALLLREWSPPCVVIDQQGYIRYIHGRTGKYLEFAPGEVDKPEIIRSTREGLRTPLTTAIYRALHQQQDIYEPGIWITTDTGQTLVNLTIKLLRPGYSQDSLLAIVFEEVQAAALPSAPNLLSADDADPKYTLMQQELTDTGEYLQAAIEELKSSNEEMQSVNEELQSTNEEMETSQEELKAVNEELITTNAELERKLEELTWANNDLSNILNNIEIGIILLDEEFQIRRFNAAATHGFHLIPGDIGRLITHVVSNLRYATLLADVQAVFQHLTPREVVVQSQEGQSYRMQIRPYRTSQNAIKGVVMVFTALPSQSEHE